MHFSAKNLLRAVHNISLTKLQSNVSTIMVGFGHKINSPSTCTVNLNSDMIAMNTMTFDKILIQPILN